MFSRRSIALSLLLLLGVLVTACAGLAEPTPTAVPIAPTPTPADTPTTAAGEANVNNVRLTTPTETADQVNVIVEGDLPDGCTTVDKISQSQTDNTFLIEITTQRQADALCTEALVPYTETILLNTANLAPGTYTVNVNGVTAQFERPSEEEATVPATETPTAGSVTIAPTSGPPGTAVQITATGLPADETVQIGIGPANSEYDIIDSALTDATGALNTQVAVPEYAEVNENWIFVVETDTDKLLANPFRVTDTGEATFDQANIYLIALEDAGQSGIEIGCGDSAVPVTVNFDPTVAPLTAALARMFAIEEEFYGQSGLYNALHASNLTVEGIDIENRTAQINLSGELSIGGTCDAPRVRAQIAQTALQFSTIDNVDIWLNGRPLSEVLNAR